MVLRNCQPRINLSVIVRVLKSGRSRFALVEDVEGNRLQSSRVRFFERRALFWFLGVFLTLVPYEIRECPFQLALKSGVNESLAGLGQLSGSSLFFSFFQSIGQLAIFR